MSATEAPETAPAVAGIRKNGKQWHESKTPIRLTGGLTSYEKRQGKRKELETMKAKEKELKDEKEAQRQRWIQGIKDKRTAKAEKERYEKLAEKMHRKRVERLKRREKRNKMIKSGK